MPKLNLEAKNETQKIIKDYLEKNVSDILADKINNGVRIQKDGKTLISKKTLAGCMDFALKEAQKLTEKSARAACIQDSVVFGWAIHFFEEDSIEGTLYNDGRHGIQTAESSYTAKACNGLYPSETATKAADVPFRAYGKQCN